MTHVAATSGHSKLGAQVAGVVAASWPPTTDVVGVLCAIGLADGATGCPLPAMFIWVPLALPGSATR